jgi:hypothetical protein
VLATGEATEPCQGGTVFTGGLFMASRRWDEIKGDLACLVVRNYITLYSPVSASVETIDQLNNSFITNFLRCHIYKFLYCSLLLGFLSTLATDAD